MNVPDLTWTSTRQRQSVAHTKQKHTTVKEELKTNRELVTSQSLCSPTQHAEKL